MLSDLIAKEKKADRVVEASQKDPRIPVIFRMIRGALSVNSNDPQELQSITQKFLEDCKEGLEVYKFLEEMVQEEKEAAKEFAQEGDIHNTLISLNKMKEYANTIGPPLEDNELINYSIKTAHKNSIKNKLVNFIKSTRKIDKEYVQEYQENLEDNVKEYMETDDLFIIDDIIQALKKENLDFKFVKEKIKNYPEEYIETKKILNKVLAGYEF